MTSAAIILAAGESKRLGRPKQLVHHQGKTLVRRAVEIAREAGIHQVVVVTGANSQGISAEIAAEQCLVTHNPDWRHGMGASIACGASFVASLQASIELVIVQTCDQPFIPPSHLGSLLVQAREKSLIAATRYPDLSPGIPACFPARYLSVLASLAGHGGAKSIIASEKAVVLTCPAAAIDVDTVADLDRLDCSDQPA